MKNSLLILACFAVGVLVGWRGGYPAWLTHPALSQLTLYVLLFLVGVAVGANPDAIRVLRRANLRLVLIPVAIIIGTLLGVSIVQLLLPGISLAEALAVGSGFGYYSLASVMVGQLHSETLGVVALLANMMREMTGLLLTPLLIRLGGRLTPVAASGSTAMVTNLPIIVRFAGSEAAITAVFSGLVLTILVPLLVTLFLGLG